MLVFSYAFPPLQVQMAPAVAKSMAGLGKHGVQVDVVCADTFSPFLARDESLLPYVEGHFGSVVRLKPSERLRERVWQRSFRLAQVPDLMGVLGRAALEALGAMDLASYTAVITWSPFHSINPVMVRLKRRHRNVRWIAQFSDPWDRNPLERHPLIRLWSRLHEPAAVRAADRIVHTSAHALELMMDRHPAAARRKAVVIPHAYEEALYPQRPKRREDVITLCHAGVLFGRRSPEPLFLALARVLEQRPSLRDRLRLDLVGVAPPEMLQTAAARALPEGLVRVVGTVGYLESLQRMYDADLLVLIEANTRHNLFLSSKLLDYLGANTPIVGLAPRGASEDILADVGCWHARPDDLDGIVQALRAALDYVSGDQTGPWCREDRRRSYDNREIAGRWLSLIAELSGA